MELLSITMTYMCYVEIVRKKVHYRTIVYYTLYKLQSQGFRLSVTQFGEYLGSILMIYCKT